MNYYKYNVLYAVHKFSHTDSSISAVHTLVNQRFNLHTVPSSLGYIYEMYKI